MAVAVHQAQGRRRCDSCQQRYSCDPINGCQSTGYNTTGTTQTECSQNRIIQSYDCNSFYGCVPRYDTLGVLTDCSSCQRDYICYGYYGGEDNYSNCYPNGFTTNVTLNAVDCCATEPCSSSIYTQYNLCPNPYY